MAIQQSGNVSPGHTAVWATDGVLMDGGALPGSQRVITSFINANFNDIGDQPLIIPAAITAFMLTGIIVTNASRSLTAAVGGFYPAASKAGTQLVADTQVYSSLTAATKLLSCTLAAAVATTRYSVANLTDWAIYFALTTAQGVDPTTADVYVLGIDLSPAA